MFGNDPDESHKPKLTGASEAINLFYLLHYSAGVNVASDLNEDLKFQIGFPICLFIFVAKKK